MKISVVFAGEEKPMELEIPKDRFMDFLEIVEQDGQSEYDGRVLRIDRPLVIRRPNDEETGPTA